MNSARNDSSKRWNRYGVTFLKKGISFGSALAMVISFSTYGSVWLAILHGILGWFYVLYYLFI